MNVNELYCNKCNKKVRIIARVEDKLVLKCNCKEVEIEDIRNIEKDLEGSDWTEGRKTEELVTLLTLKDIGKLDGMNWLTSSGQDNIREHLGIYLTELEKISEKKLEELSDFEKNLTRSDYFIKYFFNFPKEE